MTRKSVVVAMSGGVDSSVAAALLKRQSFNVIGIFMKLWSLPIPGTENRCCSIESLEGARRVAVKLKIPFYTINLAKEFKKYVVDYYLKEYLNCRTPNPCVVCNKFIKFKFLLKKAKALDADYLATGHYVRLQSNQLFQAKDKTKDQSYFLWTITQEQLKHLLFPIGDYTKKEVRKMAQKWNLPTAQRKESQGLCFIGYRNNQQFLEKFIRKKPGLILDLKGNVLGKHQGLPFYTIGQRKGIEVEARRPDAPPLYVIKIDIENNALIVGEEKDLYQKELWVDEVNWLNAKLTEQENRGFSCQVRIRYGHPAAGARLKTESCKLKISFNKPVRAVTPSQSIVFYDNEEVLGGGIITTS